MRELHGSRNERLGDLLKWFPTKMLSLEKGCDAYDPVPRFLFRMPRVVVDQKAKFETDELFRKLSRESENRIIRIACFYDDHMTIYNIFYLVLDVEKNQNKEFIDTNCERKELTVRYTGHRDRPIEERRLKFKAGCREGYTEIAFITTGTNIQLMFGQCTNGCKNRCEFDTDKNKVHVKSSFIMNGVCVRWKGSLDLERLDGIGCLEFDEELAQIEDARLQQQLEIYNKRLRDFEDKQRAFRPPRIHRTRDEVSTLDDMSSGSASN